MASEDETNKPETEEAPAPAQVTNEEEEGEEEGTPKQEDEKEKEKEKEEEEEEEMVTPREKMRPSRERKAVDRYWLASPASRSSAPKPLSIVKGSGTPLREIPNVAYKLSKRKPDDNLQLLHMILYGKKAKAHTLKKDIGQFSGFVWTDNEEKQRAKIKEKLDKCVKEKLLHFCDVLNIPINNKSSVKKEDLTVKLLEFLESPHATTEELLADVNQKGKSQKKKATSKSKTSKVASVEKSTKKTLSGEKRKRATKGDEENETDNKEDVMESESHSSEEDDAPEKPVSDGEETESDEENVEPEMTTPKISSKVKTGGGGGKKSTSTKKPSPDKSAKNSGKPEKKAVVTSKKSATTDTSASSSKAKGPTSKKQKVEEETAKEKSVPAEEKPAGKKLESKPASKVKGKGKPKKEAEKEPTNEELRAQAVKILKEVDFNTATLSDILRLLGSHFGVDLMHRKIEVKGIITDVIENMSGDEEDDDDEEDEDDDEDAQDSGKE